MTWNLWLIYTLCVIAVFKLLQTLYRGYKFRQAVNKLPGPRLLPFIGSVIDIWGLKEEDEMYWYLNKSNSFKDGFFQFWAGNVPTVHVRIPRHVEIILSSTVNITKPVFYDLITPWLGNGLLTSTGKKWFHDRKLITPAFHFSILEKFAIVMAQKAKTLMKCLEKELANNPGKPVNIQPFALRYSLDVICETAMGVNVHAQDAQDTEYIKALRRMSDIAFYRLRTPWLIWDWFFFLTPLGRECRSVINTLHRYTINVIKERKESRKFRPSGRGEDEEKDAVYNRKTTAFLDHLLDAIDNQALAWTDEEVREQVDTFMFEGHDTTGVAIGWILFCLGNYPEQQKLVHEELEEVFGDSDEPATLKDIAQLTYLDRVIKEVHRMYPSVPIIARVSEEDIKLDEHVIPKGCVIAVSPFLTHRDPENWPNPDEFDPDRFLPENSKHRHPYAYIPFSAGPRNCIGQKFAVMDEKFALAAILRKWRVKSVLQPLSVRVNSALSVPPKKSRIMLPLVNFSRPVTSVPSVSPQQSFGSVEWQLPWQTSFYRFW